MPGFFKRLGRNIGCADCGENVCCECQCPADDLNYIFFSWVTNVDEVHTFPISWSGVAFKNPGDELYPDTYVLVNGFSDLNSFYLDCGPDFSGFSVSVGVSNSEAEIAYTWLFTNENILTCEKTIYPGVISRIVTFFAEEEGGGPSMVLTISWSW